MATKKKYGSMQWIVCKSWAKENPEAKKYVKSVQKIFLFYEKTFYYE